MRGIRDAGFVATTPIQEAHAAARPQGQGRRGPVADGHRQDRGLPDRRLHALPAHARPGHERRRPRRACSSSPPRASWSCRSRPTRTCSAPTPASASVAVYGGIDYNKQREALRDGAATSSSARPGRLIDYLKQHVWSPEQRRGARHRRGRPDVRHGLHRRSALHPAPAAQAGEAAVVPVLGHAVLPRDGADLGVHEQPRPDHHHARTRRRSRRSSRCSTTSGARRSSTCSSACSSARGAAAS